MKNVILPSIKGILGVLSLLSSTLPSTVLGGLQSTSQSCYKDPCNSFYWPYTWGSCPESVRGWVGRVEAKLLPKFVIDTHQKRRKICPRYLLARGDLVLLQTKETEGILRTLPPWGSWTFFLSLSPRISHQPLSSAGLESSLRYDS